MSKADAFVNITDVICPITFVKVKVALEDLTAGQVLKIKLNAGEPIQNVPRSLKDEGHKVAGIADNNDGTYTLTVIKNGLV